MRHVACFRFIEGTTDEQVVAMTEALRALPALIPELESYHVGADLGLNEDSWDFCVVADCATTADYRSYVAHPAHQAALVDLIRPILAERASVQYAT